MKGGSSNNRLIIHDHRSIKIITPNFYSNPLSKEIWFHKENIDSPTSIAPDFAGFARASLHEFGYRDEFRLGFIWEISARFPRWELRKGQRSWGQWTRSGAKFEKQSWTWRNTNILPYEHFSPFTGMKAGSEFWRSGWHRLALSSCKQLTYRQLSGIESRRIKHLSLYCLSNIITYNWRNLQ